MSLHYYVFVTPGSGLLIDTDPDLTSSTLACHLDGGTNIDTGGFMRVIGYTTGVYDLFHIGHLNLLKQASSQCDHLVVGVTTDELCLARKGKLPVIPFEERVEIVRALRCVDNVVPQADMDKFSAWERYRFHKMFVGDDWKGHPSWAKLEQQFSSCGVEIVYFPYTAHVSSTHLRQIMANGGILERQSGGSG